MFEWMGWGSIGSNPTPFVTIFVSYLNPVSGGTTASAVCLPERVAASVRVFARTWQGVDWQTAQNPLIEFLLVCHLSFIGAFLAFGSKQVGCHCYVLCRRSSIIAQNESNE